MMKIIIMALVHNNTTDILMNNVVLVNGGEYLHFPHKSDSVTIQSE